MFFSRKRSHRIIPVPSVEEPTSTPETIQEPVQEPVQEPAPKLPAPLTEAQINHLKCPISMEIMNDPVITLNGDTFERTKIVAWIHAKHTCPMTRKPLEVKDLIPNNNLKKVIEGYRKDGRLPPATEPEPEPVIEPVLETIVSVSRWVPMVRSGQQWVPLEQNSAIIVRQSPPMARRAEQERAEHTQNVNRIRLAVDAIFEAVRERESRNRVYVEPAPEPEPVVQRPPRAESTFHTGELPPVDLPTEPDFSFIESSTVREMIHSAYQVVTENNEWDYMRRYAPSEQTGYMFDTNPRLNALQQKVDERYGLHSGVSMGYTMRNMQYIADHGVAMFRTLYES